MTLIIIIIIADPSGGCPPFAVSVRLLVTELSPLLVLGCALFRKMLLCWSVHSYVRPLLEYNCVVWSPGLVRDVTLIEQVQRRFTKRLRGLRNISYAERLKLLNLDTLESRRLKFDLIYCYKIIFGLLRVNRDEFLKIGYISHQGSSL